jgi:hypothetical protein
MDKLDSSMGGKEFRNSVGWLLLGMLLVLSIYVLGAWGTNDVDIWLSWMTLVDEHGLAKGYAKSIDLFATSINSDDRGASAVGRGEYPPLPYVVLFVTRRIGNAIGLTPWVSLKALLFLLQWGAVALFLWLFHDVVLAASFAVATLLSTVALGYLDILVVPWLLGGFQMLQVGRPLLGVLLVLMAALFKWQPLVILPFVILHALGASNFSTLWVAFRTPLSSGLRPLAFHWAAACARQSLRQRQRDERAVVGGLRYPPAP